MSDGDSSASANGGDDGGAVVDIYPLSGYYFGSTEAVPQREETIFERVERMKSNYARCGMRTCVEGVLLVCIENFCLYGGKYTCFSLVMLRHVKFLTVPICLLLVYLFWVISRIVYPIRGSLCVWSIYVFDLIGLEVELFRQPHVLLLQVRNSYFRLPGGRLRPDESEIDGLKRKLSSKLGSITNSTDVDWQINECLGLWWRSDFDTMQHPYLPSNARKPKECTKVFLVRLPMNVQFTVPKNFKLLAVPLFQIHGSHETYGPVISDIPQLLSKFTINIIDS